jgi:hypothetical protein
VSRNTWFVLCEIYYYGVPRKGYGYCTTYRTVVALTKSCTGVLEYDMLLPADLRGSSLHHSDGSKLQVEL